MTTENSSPILSLEEYTAFRVDMFDWLRGQMLEPLYLFNLFTDTPGRVMHERMLMIGGQVLAPNPEVWFTQHAKGFIEPEKKWPALIFVDRLSVLEWETLNRSETGSDRIDRRFYSTVETEFGLSPQIAPRDVLPDFGAINYADVIRELGFRGGVLADHTPVLHGRTLRVNIKAGQQRSELMRIRGGTPPYLFSFYNAATPWMIPLNIGYVFFRPTEADVGHYEVFVVVTDADNTEVLLKVIVDIESAL